MSEVDSELLSELHQRTSAKWRKYNVDILPMHVAEMDFDVAPEIKKEIITRVEKGDLGYLGPIPELGPAFQGFASKRWGWTPDIELISLAADVGVAAIEIFRVLANPGDRILINSPVYNNFYTWIEESKLELVDVPLIKSQSSWTLDLDGIEEAFKSGVKLYLLCNPQNPVGRVHRRLELEAIAQMSTKYGVSVISDEIHAGLTYPDVAFTPYLTTSSGSEFGYTITSASKSWNIAGLKAAMIIPGSQSAAKRISKMPPAVHWRTSIIGAFAMVSAFKDSVAWLDQTISQLDSNRNMLSDLLSQELPDVEYLIPESSYLAWLYLGKFGTNSSWHDQILDKGKVSIVPGQDYGRSYSDYVRLNFATYPEVLHEGVNRLAQALQ
jgi:cystathionine beta-lyase